MNDRQKLHELAIILEQWRMERQKLERMASNYPTDLITGRLVTIADHISQLEGIIYAPSHNA